jgi:predicted enzyme related to lactoylglutathione lyase
MIRRIWDITLTVSNVNRAVTFYGDILGLQKKYQFSDYAGFDCGGIEIGLKTWGECERPRMGEPCLSLLVDDVDAVFDELTQKRVHFVEPPKNTQWGGRIAVLSDPDGNRIQLVQVEWQRYFSACLGSSRPPAN